MFDVRWTRPGESEVLECRRLTELQLARRLYGAVRNFGEVTIVSIERSPVVTETIDSSRLADAIEVGA